MPKLKVYISSTYRDMADANVRDFIIERIQNGLPENFELTRIMEQMDGDFLNRFDIDFCLEQVRKADLYILLIGSRYGSSPEKYTNGKNELVVNEAGLSYTELEYITAEETFKTKFYGIYKIYISDLFFENIGGTIHSDLSDLSLKLKFDAFKKKVDNGASMITIDNDINLTKTINNKLSEFLNYSNSFIQLNINDYDKMSINRHTQHNIITTKKNPDILSDIEPLGKISKSVVFVFNSTCPDDDPEKFGKRIKNEVFDTINSNPDLQNPQYISFDDLISSALGNDSEEVISRILERILTKCSMFLFTETDNSCTFETLPTALRAEKKLNKFIYINIELNEHEKRNLFSINIITKFIQKMENTINSIIDENGKPYMSANLFFALNLISFEYDHYIKYNDMIASNLKQIECINLTKLDKVPSADVMNWLTNIINKKNMNLVPEEIYKFIFSDIKAPPKHYKEYIHLLETKIRV